MKNDNMYIIKTVCIKEGPGLNSRLGEERIIGEIESSGLAYISAKAIKDVIGKWFDVTIEKA